MPQGLRKGPENLPRGMEYVLPTALGLIAKINIHYCNYFLRRGCVERERETETGRKRTRGRQAARRGRGQNERRRLMRRKESGEAGERVRERTRTAAALRRCTRCNESFIDVVSGRVWSSAG